MTNQPATQPLPQSSTQTSKPSAPADTLTLRDILSIPEAAMDQAMGIAYQLYLSGRLADTETVCKGLIACDHRYWWPHTLHASVLRRLGRYEEAFAAVEEGLKHEPGQPKLSLMRAELVSAITRRDERLAREAKLAFGASDVGRDGAPAAPSL